MPRLKGGLHGLKADPSARADDQDARHGVVLPVEPAWLTLMCDAVNPPQDGRLRNSPRLGKAQRERPSVLAEMPIRLPALPALWPKPFTACPTTSLSGPAHICRMTSAESWLASSNRLHGSVMRNGMGAGRQKAYNCMVLRAK